MPGPAQSSQWIHTLHILNYCIRFLSMQFCKLWFCCSVLDMTHLLHVCPSWERAPEVSSSFSFSQFSMFSLTWIEVLRTTSSIWSVLIFCLMFNKDHIISCSCLIWQMQLVKSLFFMVWLCLRTNTTRLVWGKDHVSALKHRKCEDWLMERRKERSADAVFENMAGCLHIWQSWYFLQSCIKVFSDKWKRRGGDLAWRSLDGGA